MGKSTSQPSNPMRMLVCATIPVLGGQQARCSECDAIIWSTSGSLEEALREAMPMICLDCFMKIKNFTFGGFMHDGALVPELEGERMYRLLERALREKLGEE
jgi:hypothetical protein